MCATSSTDTQPRFEIIDGEPAVPMLGLETVWFQITGTLCNLKCTHCFVECSPTNHTHEFMSLELMRERMDEAIRLGAQEFGFTGGEPFMHPQILDTLEYALDHAPALVLTNATLITEKMAQRLQEITNRTTHTLDIRVSLDGETEEQNDSVRGNGSFNRAMRGIRNLTAVGIKPSIATTATWGDTCPDIIEQRMRGLLASHGVKDVPVKIFPNIMIGAEAERSRPYQENERVTSKCVEGADPRNLMCSTSRLVTERGVWICTLLPNVEEAKMGETIEETLTPFKITHGACYTCFVQGVRCTAS